MISILNTPFFLICIFTLLNPSFSTKTDYLYSEPPIRNSSHLKYIGCFDFWRNPIEEYTTTTFYPKLSLDQCEYFCRTNGGHGEADLFMTRGVFCGCHTSSIIDRLVPVDESLCSFPCSPSSTGEPRACGGTNSISIYCDPMNNGTSCEDIPRISPATHPKTTIEQQQPITKQQATPILPCFNCTDIYSCFASNFRPWLTYIPDNSASVCSNFCANNLEYYDAKTSSYQIRNATKYANVGWANRGFPIATCGCFDELPPYEIVDVENCKMPCPTSPEEFCGGQPPTFFTMYQNF